MTRPIETTENITFTYDGDTFKQLAPDQYVQVMSDGTEVPITKQSDKLMDALLGGEVLDKS